ncbi:MAG: PAS domain S-box protein [Desulfomonile tiedjei]|nr:PAS domain S-box protein [Desulfomonile tiedjei]
MLDEDKTRDELIAELLKMRRRVGELESALKRSGRDRASSSRALGQVLTKAIQSSAERVIKHDLRNDRGGREYIEHGFPKDDELYRMLVETDRDIVWTLDLELRYTSVSPSVTKALGYSVEETMAVNALDGLTPPSRARILRAYQEELAIEAAGPRDRYTSRTEEIERYHKDGSTRWEEVTMTFLRDADGGIIGILGISHDITQRKHKEKELLRARRELEERVQERTAALIALNEKLMLQIEERKKAEKSLRESEHMLRSILDTSPVAIALISRDREIKWANEAGIRMFGYEKESECVKQNARILYRSRQEFERTGQIVYDGLEAGRVTETDAEFKRKDGSTFFGHIRTKALDPSNLSRGAISAVYDITESRKAQEALKESKARYKSLYSMMRLMCDNVPDLIWAKDLEGRYVFVNRAMGKRLLNARDTDEPIGKTNKFFAEREKKAHPDDPHWHTFGETRTNSDQQVMSTKKPQRFGVFGRVKGKLLYLDVYKAPFWNEQGEMIGTVGCGRDVTRERAVQVQRKRTEEALKESEERYRLLVQLSPDGIGVHIGGRFVFANKSAADLLGVANPEELINRSITEFVHPDYMETVAARLKGLAEGKPQELTEERLVRVDGQIIDVEVAAVPVSYRAEAAAQVFFRDISARKRSHEAQKRMVTAVEQSADAVAITDHLGRIQYINPAFELITGHTGEEVIGKSLAFLKSRDHDETFDGAMWEAVLKGEGWKGRVVGERKDHEVFHAIITISPVRDPSGKIQNFVGVGHDITQQVQLERQLLQAQKMEAIGTLAGGIAHDFNNLLQITLGYSELLLSDKKETDAEHADLSKILQAAKNGAELVQRLLTFSRKVEPKLIPLNLNRQIGHVEKLLRRTIPKMIDIQTDLSGDPAEINADPSQMEQVLMNLAVNARDAMPEGGKITLGTKNVSLDEEYCRLNIGSKPGQYVALTVSDTGHGMDKTTIEHIFEPFYTTKEAGRGTGLGLAMVYGIVKQHEGYITCESEVGHGTIFRVYFPQSRAPEQPRTETPELPYVTGTETILLVDDEEVLRDLGERILTQAGYAVITASNGEEALGLFNEKKDRIALVILDLFMPTLGGKECLKKLVKIDPQVRILVASGYSGDASVRESFDLGARGFVSKPCGFKELLQEVRKALDEG